MSEQRVNGDGLSRREKAGGKPSRADDAFFFKDVVAVVIVDDAVEGIEVERLKEDEPVAVETRDGGRQVAGRGAA